MKNFEEYKGERQEIEEKSETKVENELHPDKQIEEITTKIEANRIRITCLSELIDNTESDLDVIREKLDIPSIEDDTPSTNTTREQLEKLKLEQKELKKQKDELINRQEVLKNPEFVGLNFDQSYIIDGRSYWSQEKWIEYIKNRDGEIPVEIDKMIESGESQKELSRRIQEEEHKKESFEEYLAGFNGELKHARINPAGEFSPFSPSQMIEIDQNGTFEAKIESGAVEQIKKIKDQVEDLTIVIPFFDHRRGKEKASDVPETEELTERYIKVCKSVIKEIGDNIQLEIGNETNVSRNTGKQFEDKLQHASDVDPLEYAEFYKSVAERIKKESPKIKLSIAGVACFDPDYLRRVLDRVTDSGRNTSLVDTISFHPYRKDPEGGSVEIKSGKFLETSQESLSYEEQLKEMKRIADKYGVEINVGEINFSGEESRSKLQKANSMTSKERVSSLIYPGFNLPQKTVRQMTGIRLPEKWSFKAPFFYTKVRIS